MFVRRYFSQGKALNNWLASLLLGCLFTHDALAGLLVLSNGDELTGKIVAINKAQFVWNSPVLGELKIAKTNVADLTTLKALKVPGIKQPCYWVGLINERVIFRCGVRNETVVPLMTLTDVVTYSQFLDRGRTVSRKLLVQGSQSRGNTESSDWLVDHSFLWDFGDVSHKATLTYSSRYIEQQQEAAIEKYMGVYRLGWQVLPKWFVFGDVSAVKDDARNLEERYDFGLGFGYKFWEDVGSAFSLESGAQQTAERLSPAETQADSEYASWRIASIFRYKVTQDIAIRHESEFLQSLMDSKDWEAGSMTSLVMPILLGISADFTLSYDFDNTPSGSEASIEDDVVFRVGLGYQW